MIGALWNGLSGVVANAGSINVTSNNMANVNTIAHKSDRIIFEDLMYEDGFGNGVAPQIVEKNFDQGEMKVSNGNYDAAIDGKGFFVLEDSTTSDTYYSRAGNLQIGIDGFLQNAGDLHVQGLGTTVSSVVSTNTDTQFDYETHTEYVASQSIATLTEIISFNAKSSNYEDSAVATGTSGQNYKSAGSLISDVESLKTEYRNRLDALSADPNATAVASTTQQTTLTYTNYTTDLDSSGSFMELYVNDDLIRQDFDTDAQTTMNKFTDKLSSMGGLNASFDASTKILTIDALIPGKNIRITAPIINSTSPTITTTAASLGSGIGMVDSARDALKTSLENAGAEFIEIQNTLTLANEDSLTLTDINLKLDSMGISEDGRSDFSIVDDGLIMLTQDDNKFIVGKLTTVFFTDQTELEAMGDTLYSETEESGIARHAGILNQIHGNMLELSNTNLAEGLTNVVVMQRAFESSSRSITTADEFLKTAIQMKK